LFAWLNRDEAVWVTRCWRTVHNAGARAHVILWICGVSGEREALANDRRRAFFGWSKFPWPRETPLPPRHHRPGVNVLNTHPSRARTAIARALVGALALYALPLAAQGRRPMNFLDVQNMRQAGLGDLSPDGKWMLYTISVPDWREARRQSDIYMVSTE